MDNEKKYALYVNDSKVADGLTRNGTNYVSASKVDTSSMVGLFKLDVKDDAGTIVEQYEHAKLLQQEQYAWDDNKYYLAFAPVSEQEVMNAEFRSNLDYLAMCADVSL